MSLTEEILFAWNFAKSLTIILCTAVLSIIPLLNNTSCDGDVKLMCQIHRHLWNVFISILNTWNKRGEKVQKDYVLIYTQILQSTVHSQIYTDTPRFMVTAHGNFHF